MLPFAADTVILFVAASLAKPLQPVLDTFAARTHTVILRESGASLEHVRKITELKRIPDLLLLADAEVFPQFLVPAYTTWYSEFARNRMVIAYTNKSKHAKQIDANNWRQILGRGDVEVGRTDPNLAPVGYRTMLLLQLAEKHYKSPGLSRRLLDNAPKRNIRPNAAELAALLSAGELDYIYEYQSVAESNGFRFIPLPDAINLGDASRAAEYGSVSVEVRGTARGTKTTFKGQPILYGASIPRDAPHRRAAELLYLYLTSDAVAEQLRKAHVDMLARPIVVGSGAPTQARGTVRRP
jgi:molybdate/tungstate transport system substrate-binding protein